MLTDYTLEEGIAAESTKAIKVDIVQDERIYYII